MILAPASCPWPPFDRLRVTSSSAASPRGTAPDGPTIFLRTESLTTGRPHRGRHRELVERTSRACTGGGAAAVDLCEQRFRVARVRCAFEGFGDHRFGFGALVRE